MKIVIVGGVAGGASAAARARRLSETAEIVVFEKGQDPSFANCGMPYYIGGEIENRDKLLVAPLTLLRERHRLDVRIRSQVEAIDRQNKTVTVRSLDDNRTYQESYDQLILATGAAPLKPPIPGIDSAGIYTLRDLQDADQLHAVATGGAKSAVIVGAGFIGIEMAENLARRGLAVTIVELADQVLPPWDKEMVTPIESHLEASGVALRLGDSATAFATKDGQVVVTLKSGEQMETDFVVLSVGVRPENQLAKDAGLDLGDRGGVKVNRYMQTSDPDIYAVGDVVEVTDVVSNSATQIPLAGPANRQGRIAADHIFGRETYYRGTQGTAVVGVFDMTAAMTGLSEKVLKRLEMDYQKIYIHPAHHAGYYPGAQPMSLKLLFEPTTGRILGAQAVGRQGVDKRIDVIAMAIQADMNVLDLEESELCYAPQFGSAKDPVNMAGFVASGVVRGDHPVVHCDQVLSAVQAGAALIDVRSEKEFSEGHIPGAVNQPIDSLRDHLGALPQDKPIIVYCYVGMRGYLATRILLQNGFDVKNLSGGYKSWRMFADA